MFSRTLGTALFLAIASTLIAADTATPAPKGLRVFTAGHSFHLPLVLSLDDIAHSAGVKEHKLAGRQMLGGSTVTQHWDLPDDKETARKTIKAGKVDVLTLSPHFMVPDPAIDQYTALLLENNPNGRVTVQASWLPNSAELGKILNYKDADRDATKPDDLRRAGKPWLDKIREQVKSINEKYPKPVVFVVPVGEAVVRLRERVVKGEVPGIPKQSALFTDSLGHGRPPIGVLTAYCHFAVIYGQSPVGLPVPPALKGATLGDNTEKVNRILQECAWEAVTSEPASGVKPVKAQ